MSPPIQLLCQGASPPDLSTSALGPFIVQRCADLSEVPPQLEANRFDALLLHVHNGEQLHALLHWGGLSHAVLDTALLVLMPEPSASDLTRLLQLGVQEVMPTREAHPERIALALRLSVERKRLELAARRAYATDLATGLPNHAQLLEHMTHLLALREREPAPMALLVLRIEGLATAGRALGAEAANVLRRKVAVRLRAGLARQRRGGVDRRRLASPCCWPGSTTPADGERVVGKLAKSLQQPFSVAGQDAGGGGGRRPGAVPRTTARTPTTLLRRAGGQAIAGQRARPHGFCEPRASAARTAPPTTKLPTQLTRRTPRAATCFRCRPGRGT